MWAMEKDPLQFAVVKVSRTKLESEHGRLHVPQSSGYTLSTSLGDLRETPG